MGNLSLRVSSDIRKIDVNDNGDYIEVNLSDIKFMEKIEGFVSKLNSVKDFALSVVSTEGDVSVTVEELEDESVSLDERKLKADKLIEELKTDKRVELINKVEGLKADFDSVFGVKAADKVFGNGLDVTPNVAMYFEFLNLFIPLISKMVKERRRTTTSVSKITPKKGGKR